MLIRLIALWCFHFANVVVTVFAAVYLNSHREYFPAPWNLVFSWVFGVAAAHSVQRANSLPIVVARVKGD